MSWGLVAIGGMSLVGSMVTSKAAGEATEASAVASAAALEFAEQQYTDWQETYGPLQDNMAEYYSGISPDYYAAQGLENFQQEQQVRTERMQETFAQRGIDPSSGIAMSLEAQSELEGAEHRAKIRSDAPRQAAEDKTRFLQIGLGQNPASATQGALSNQAIIAGNQAQTTGMMAGQAWSDAGTAVGTALDAYNRRPAPTTTPHTPATTYTPNQGTQTMANPYVAAGITSGLAKVSTSIATRDQREAQRKEAMARQQLATSQLDDYQSQAPQREKENELRMQQLETQTRQANTTSLQEVTYSAFQRFQSDNDVRHLNTWIADAKKNPVGANLYGDTARIDALTKSADTDKMLRAAGYENPDDVYDNPELDSLVTITKTDGTQVVVDMNTMYAGTGYTRYQSNQQLEDMERKARISQMTRGGGTVANISLKEKLVNDMVANGEAKTISEAYGMIEKLEQGQSGSPMERMVKQLMEDDPNLSLLEALDLYNSKTGSDPAGTNEQQFIDSYMKENEGASHMEASRAYANRGATTTQKELGTVDAVKDQLDESNFLDIPMSEMTKKERLAAHRHIAQIEDLRGVKLSNEDKRTLRNLRELSVLGAKAGDLLTPEETGLMDRTLTDFKKYMFQEVGGREGTAAYETFRNIYRNALFGATLTASEEKNFNKAAGTLGQKFGPVMEALKGQMETVKSQMEAIRDLEDPYLAHYYMGTSLEDIDDAIYAIDERLDGLSLNVIDADSPDAPKITVSKAIPPTQAEKVQATPVPTKEPGEPVEFDFNAAMQAEGL